MTPIDAKRRTAPAPKERSWSRLGRQAPARLAALALADSTAHASQAEVMERLQLTEDEFAQGIFARAGVERRYLNLEPDFLAENLQGRAGEVEQGLLDQAVLTIDKLGIQPETVGTLISSSLYSLGCPTLAHRLIEHYGMDPATDKYHVTGVGCASAVPLLRLGVQSLHANPSRQVLVVAAESMSSIMMRAGEDDPRAKTVGSAIFGDGCAAALLSSERGAEGPAIIASRVHQIPGSLDAVHLKTSADDSHLHLARDLPDIAAEGLGELVEDFLRASHIEREDIEHWMLHPGGRRIVEKGRDALGLDDDDVAVSWEALADHGNIGTPSIFYVLHSTIEKRQPAAGDHGLCITIGPGVSVGLMLLEF